MKALELALLVEELEQADLSPAALQLAMSGITARQHLEIGRNQLKAVRYIEQAIREGRSQAYAIDTAATLFGDRWLTEIWKRYTEQHGPALVAVNDFGVKPAITERA